LTEDLEFPLGDFKLHAQLVDSDTVSLKLSGLPSVLPNADLIRKLDLKLNAGISLGVSFDDVIKNPNDSLLFKLMRGIKVNIGGECGKVSKTFLALEELSGEDWPDELENNIPLTAVDINLAFGFNKDAKISSAADFLSTFDTLTSFAGMQGFVQGFVQNFRGNQASDCQRRRLRNASGCSIASQ
jgi:hypothetical protein